MQAVSNKTVTLALLGLFSSTSFAAGLATGQVSYRNVPLTYAADGVVEAVRQSTVSAQVAGRITELKWKAGDFVPKGSVIVRIDETQAAQGVAASQAQLAEARAQLENARSNLERSKQLFQQKFISQSALDSAQTGYEAAQARVNAMVAGAGQAATARGFSTLIAPYSGVVAAVHAEVGEMAAPGKPLITGFDPADLRVVASIPQSKLASVRGSNQSMVEIAGLAKWVKPQTMTVLPVADSRSHTADVRLNLPTDLRGVVPGMYAKAYFTIGQARKLVVPASAILRRSELTAVYVVQKDVPQLRQVRLGDAADENGYEVLAGLREGEQVALDPNAAAARTANAK